MSSITSSLLSTAYICFFLPTISVSLLVGAVFLILGFSTVGLSSSSVSLLAIFTLDNGAVCFLGVALCFIVTAVLLDPLIVLCYLSGEHRYP